VGHLIGASGSGRELTAAGLGADVAHAAELDASTAVPVLRGEQFVRLEG
jgi:2-phosphosulfolactate phosphatase